MATARKRRKPTPKISQRKAAPAKARRAPASKAKVKPQPKPRAPGIVRGVHALLYSSQADELRAFIRDKLGFKATDAKLKVPGGFDVQLFQPKYGK